MYNIFSPINIQPLVQDTCLRAESPVATGGLRRQHAVGWVRVLYCDALATGDIAKGRSPRRLDREDGNASIIRNVGSY